MCPRSGSLVCWLDIDRLAPAGSPGAGVRGLGATGLEFQARLGGKGLVFVHLSVSDAGLTPPLPSASSRSPTQTKHQEGRGAGGDVGDRSDWDYRSPRPGYSPRLKGCGRATMRMRSRGGCRLIRVPSSHVTQMTSLFFSHQC